MKPLVDEYFKRELNDEEEEELSRQLADSPEEAARMAEGMAALYRKSGQIEPEWIDTPLRAPKRFDLEALKLGVGACAIVALIGSMAYWGYRALEAPAPPSTVTDLAAPQNGLPSVQGQTSGPSDFDHPASAAPKHKYEQLSVSIDNPAPAPVTVRVLDPSGQPVRVLYNGILPPGNQTFIWDGRTDEGNVASAGDYSVQVQSGSQVMSKTVHVGASSQP